MRFVCRPDLEAMGLSTAGNHLISVTDASDIEEFMAAAAMADRSFAAERGIGEEHESLVMLGEDGEIVAMGKGAAAEAAKPDVTGPEGVLPLRVPRRPDWEEGMSRNELLKVENRAFLAWRRSIADQEAAHTSSVASGAGGEMGGVAVTPFEKNIEMWRQLWRVVERSDVVIQVVDARQPLLYRCPDLEEYVKEINPLKESLLLVNKADFLSDRQRLEWGVYLRDQGVRFVFFSAHAEILRLEEEARATTKHGVDVFVALEEGIDLRDLPDDEHGSNDGSVGAPEHREEFDVGETSMAEELSAVAEQLGLDQEFVSACRVMTREELLDYIRENFGWLRAHVTAGRTTSKAELRLQAEADKARRRLEMLEQSEQLADDMAGFSAEALGGPEDDDTEAHDSTDEPHEAKRVAFAVDDEPEVDDEKANEYRRLGARVWAQEVSDDAAASAVLQELEGRKLVVGTVGYPNVGKSSVINAILGVTANSHRQKRAGVGSTPGKTKHFQTLPLSDDLVLCDCPGLVFPSFVSTRAEMVTAGVLNVDEMRQHYPPIALVCERIPRFRMEKKYGIKIPKPGLLEDPKRPPRPRELLDALCHMRGFMAATHAGPDHPRGSRTVLKDYLSGKLLFVHPPPSLPPRRRMLFLNDTTPDRAIFLNETDEAKGEIATSKTVGGVGWAENVLLADVAVGDSVPPTAAAEEPEVEAEAEIMDSIMEEEDKLLFGDDDPLSRAPGGSKRNRKIKGLRKGKGRKLRKGERDPDPYGTQITEEQMFWGVVSDADKQVHDRREARINAGGGTGGVSVKVMTGAASDPALVGDQTTFSRVSRPFPAADKE
jgi:large subunit GTPase 1